MIRFAFSLFFINRSVSVIWNFLMINIKILLQLNKEITIGDLFTASDANGLNLSVSRD